MLGGGLNKVGNDMENYYFRLGADLRKKSVKKCFAASLNQCNEVTGGSTLNHQTGMARALSVWLRSLVVSERANSEWVKYVAGDFKTHLSELFL